MEGNTHTSHGKVAPSMVEEDPKNVMTSESLESDPADLLDEGECPWCDEGDFSDARMHARQKHPDDYEEFVNGGQ